MVATKEQVLKELEEIKNKIKSRDAENESLKSTLNQYQDAMRDLTQQLEAVKNSKPELGKVLAELISPYLQASTGNGVNNEGNQNVNVEFEKIHGLVHFRQNHVTIDTAKGPKDQILAVMFVAFKGKKKRIDAIRNQLIENKWKDAADNLPGYLQELIATGDVIEEYEDRTHKGYRLPSEVVYEEAPGARL